MEEFPGLMAAGMHAIGRFGIGFFSVFMLGPVIRVYSRRYDKGQDTGRLLEFRGGTSSRPILSPLNGEPVPIDGGTRVEVLLKSDPNESGGLLSANSYSKAIPLAKLVGAVAPNLDVALDVMTEKGTQRVTVPGDWLKISDLKLTGRLHPTAAPSEEDVPKKSQGLLQPIADRSDRIFGRAFIAPSRRYWSPDGGWMTISGLRAGRLQNLEGVLLGEAMTAARDAARPLATKEALAEWASRQAKLIAKTVKHEEKQALSAEVVLECGGELGDLKIVKWGSDWLNSSEFEDRLRSSTEIAISFEGEFDYDEDQDDVHPKEFREEFKVSEKIALVLKHDGAILSGNNYRWPSSITGQPKPDDSHVADHVRQLISGTWGEDLEEDEEDRTVGKVRYSTITRRVTVFRIAQEDELF
jgi:hypothetical protein